jgi:DNA mismatch repair protein MutL
MLPAAEKLPDNTGVPDNLLGPEIPPDVSMPQYKIVGEVFNTYIIIDFGEKMLLVDKHAAHERIIFEKFKAGMKSAQIHSQVLIVPVEFMLRSDEVLILTQYRDEIEKIGFHFETEKYTVKVSAIPEIIDLQAVQDVFLTIADRLINEAGSAGLTRDIIFEKALYQASCKAAIKAGREYSPDHIKWLIGKLIEIPDITVCPHGRPVAMEISRATLDRQFKRT